MVSNTSLVFLEIPTDAPVPGKHLDKRTEEFDVESVALNGGVVVKVKAVSLDPYMRGRMRSAEVSSYSAAYPVGKPVTAFAIGEIIRSENDSFPVGKLLYGHYSASEYAVVPKDVLTRCTIIENKEGLPFTTLVGAAGMSGQTAYLGFYTFGTPKKGETIFVSAAAGAVGQIVCQLAKREGLKVIASAGDDQKVKFLREELGVDVAWNYKTESTEEKLKANPFHIFFDNVAGETLDLVLANIEPFGRIIACGAVSQYNVPADQRYRLKNYFNIVAKQTRYQGFIVSLGHDEELKPFFVKIPKLLASGEIKIREVAIKGFDHGEHFCSMLKGDVQGKAVIDLS